MATASHWTLDWTKRPPEEAALFNPAFCGELLLRATVDYLRLTGSPMPLPMAFLVLPLTLHPPTRNALPKKADTTLPAWSSKNEHVIASLPDRVLRLRPVSREALLFLAQHGAVSITPQGIGLGPRRIQLSPAAKTSLMEVDEMRRSAQLLGRLFGTQSSPAALLQTMGVRP